MTAFLLRQRQILDFTISALMRRKGRNGALLSVCTLLVFLVASLLFFSSALRGEARLVLAEAPEIVVQRMVAGRTVPVPEEWRSVIAAMAGVADVRPRLWGYQYDRSVGAAYTLLVPGEVPPEPGSVAIGSTVASSRGAHPGEILGFAGSDGVPRSFRIQRILPAETALVAGDLILLGEEDFRSLSGLPRGRATDLAVRLRSPDESGAIVREIAVRFPDSRPVTRNEILMTYDSLFGRRSGLASVVMAVSALAFALLAWDRATGLSAEERREIAILRGIGWGAADVLCMKFWEGVIVSLTACLWGTALAYLHLFPAGYPLFAPVLRGWSTLWPQFRLTPFIDLPVLAALFALTVLPYTAITVLPAWRAAAAEPDAQMR